MNKITKIDFSTGRVHWEVDGVHYSFPDLSVHAMSARCITASSLDFHGLNVALACRNNEPKSLSIGPPDGYDFEACEIWAPRLAERLSTICPKEIYPHNGQAVFDWGKLKLYTEWRDGGWGLHLDYETNK